MININPSKDFRYKRLKHSEDIIIQEGDILQDICDNGNIFYSEIKGMSCGFWHVIGWSTKLWRFPNVHRAVWRLKNKYKE